MAQAYNIPIANGGGWPHHKYALDRGGGQRLAGGVSRADVGNGETMTADPPKPSRGIITLTEQPGLGCTQRGDTQRKRRSRNSFPSCVATENRETGHRPLHSAPSRHPKKLVRGGLLLSRDHSIGNSYPFSAVTSRSRSSPLRAPGTSQSGDSWFHPGSTRVYRHAPAQVQEPDGDFPHCHTSSPPRFGISLEVLNPVFFPDPSLHLA